MGILSKLAFLSIAAGSVYGDGLNTRSKAAGKVYFGTATDNGELTDSAYTALLNNTEDFGAITPGNSMKWDTIEPTRGTFSYTKGDVIADLAAANNQLLRCHTLVWYSQLPSWVSNGNFDNATLIDIMTNHITNEVTHYKGKCYAWDVVNEALNEDGTYRDNVFYKTIGEAYLPIAFAAAAAADPDALLYYNDYNIESSGAKSTAAQNIVKLVQSYGAKIDGVGLQAHLIVGSVGTAASLASNLEAFTALNVDVAYTELDIRTTTPASDDKLAQQATDYANVATACKNVERCVGVTIWDFTDKYSWVPSVFSGQGEALPWDEDLNKKPAYTSILNAWGSAATGGAQSSAVATGQATAAPTSAAPTSAAPTSAVQTSAIPTTFATSTRAATSAAAAPTGTSTGTAAHWAQCGGIGFNGPTTCASPYTCNVVNDYYSQCL